MKNTQQLFSNFFKLKHFVFLFFFLLFFISNKNLHNNDKTDIIKKKKKYLLNLEVPQIQVFLVNLESPLYLQDQDNLQILVLLFVLEDRKLLENRVLLQLLCLVQTMEYLQEKTVKHICISFLFFSFFFRVCVCVYQGGDYNCL